MSKSNVILALIALASLGLAGGMWMAPPSSSDLRVAELERKLHDAEATIARLQKQRSSSLAAINNSNSPGATLEEVAASALSPKASRTAGAASAAAPVPSGPTSNPSAPASNDPRQLKSLAEAEARYADLISQFQLQPDEKEFFKQLAAKRSNIRKQATTKLQDPSLTPAQRQAILTAAKTELDQNDGEVRQFLNNDGDFGKFATWEQTEIERAQMDAGRAIFENNGVPLSADQEDWLVKSTYQLRNDTKGVADPYNLESLIGTRVDQGYVRNVLQKFDRDTQVLMQNARGKFSPQQLDAINAWRTQQRVQVESRLWNMSRTTGTTQ
jgi:hypothetical protein